MARLDRLGDASMRSAEPRARETVDDRCSHDRVGEAEAKRTRFEHEPRGDGLVERGEHCVLVEPPGGDDDVEIEVRSDHGGQLEGGARGFGQTRQAPTDDFAHAVRHTQFRRGVDRPPTLLDRDQCARLDQV